MAFEKVSEPVRQYLIKMKNDKVNLYKQQDSFVLLKLKMVMLFQLLQQYDKYSKHHDKYYLINYQRRPKISYVDFHYKYLYHIQTYEKKQDEEFTVYELLFGIRILKLIYYFTQIFVLLVRNNV